MSPLFPLAVGLVTGASVAALPLLPLPSDPLPLSLIRWLAK